MNEGAMLDKFNETYMESNDSFSKIVENLREKIIFRKDLPYASVEKQLEILDDLCSFPLGRFFLDRRGADGFWTDYIINYPNIGAKTGLNSEGKPFSPIEKFILEKCPLTLATRERFKIFQGSIQKILKDQMILASIPCGIMRDLLTLDFSNMSSFSLIGVDLDSRSLMLARQLASEYGLEKYITLIERDAWNLQFNNQIDIITSNGLNVYVSDSKRLMELYLEFYKSLKKNGVLIIGVLTYPPNESNQSEWILEKIPNEDLMLERILFQDILDCKWRNFRTPNEMRDDFYAVGFCEIQILFDKYHIFPTVIAKK